MTRESSHPDELIRRRKKRFIQKTTIGTKGLKWSKKQFEKRQAAQPSTPRTDVCPTCGGNEVLFEGSERQQACPDCQH